MITATCLGTCSSVSPRNGVGLLSHRETAPRGTPNRPENPNREGNSRVSASSSSPTPPPSRPHVDVDAVSSPRAPPKGRCTCARSLASSSAASSLQVDARRGTVRDPRRMIVPPRLEKRRARDVVDVDGRASRDANDARDIARVVRWSRETRERRVGECGDEVGTMFAKRKQCSRMLRVESLLARFFEYDQVFGARLVVQSAVGHGGGEFHRASGDVAKIE